MLRILKLTRWSYKLLIIGLVLSLGSIAVAATNNKETALVFLKNWEQTSKENLKLPPTEKDQRSLFIKSLKSLLERSFDDARPDQSVVAAISKHKEITVINSSDFSKSYQKTIENLALAIGSLPEKNEDYLVFVKNFIEFTGFENPKSLDAFSDSRSYSNGTNTLSAAPIDLEQAGKAAEIFLEEQITPLPEWLSISDNPKLSDEFQPSSD